MKTIVFYLQPFKIKLFFSFLFIFIAASIASFLPFWEGKIVIGYVSKISKNKDFLVTMEFFWLLFRNLCFYIIVTCLRIFYNKLLITSIHSGIQNLRQDIQKKIHLLPASYFETNTLGNIMSRMTNDIDIISNCLQQTCSSCLYSSFFIILSTMWMFWINWKLGLIVFLLIPISFYTIFKLSSKSQNVFIERFEKSGHYSGFLQEKYTGYKEIILYNYQSQVIQELELKNNDLKKLVFKSHYLSGLLLPIIKFFTYLIVVIISILGSILMSNDQPEWIHYLFGIVLELGILQAFIKYVWCLESPISELTQMSVLINSAKAAWNRVFRFLYEAEETKDAEKTLFLDSFKNDVVFKNVFFSYGSKTILKDINFTVKKGQMIAIVGPTGSGKSTLINLLMRFYDIEKGSILVDNINIKDFSKDHLRKIFGMVLQDTWLFKGTIFDNIKYGNTLASDEEVLEAAKQANVELFINSKNDGYNTMINEESDNLSQGEKQIITIARTILRNPNILILDEATSTVDTRTEYLLQQAIQKLLSNRTSFVIAHRLSTIVNADKILFLKDGQIQEMGTHKELLSQKGLYFQLYQSQFQ